MKLPKDFFQWVFDIMGFSDVKKEITVNSKSTVSNIYKDGLWENRKKNYKNVNRYTRAGKSGKVIYCPVCGEAERVDNFAWGVAECPSCGTTSDKYDWLVQ